MWHRSARAVKARTRLGDTLADASIAEIPGAPVPQAEIGESRQPLPDRIHVELREDILRARLQPGQTIREPELAERFGVSKTPVREALRLLVQDGWVIVLPRKGYLIRPLGLEDLREVFHLREMLEPGFAAEAAWRAAGQGGHGVRDAVEAQRTAGPDFDLALASASAFHIRIAELAGNARGAKIVANLVDEVTRLHYLMPSLEAHIESREELDAHEQIASAIEAGNHKEASRAMRDHLRATDRALVEVFGVPRRRARA
jgi:DNA-binding GntR family transcriptional regulator